MLYYDELEHTLFIINLRMLKARTAMPAEIAITE
jgi:hypothetical protein